jgi:hypothetical protein
MLTKLPNKSDVGGGIDMLEPTVKHRILERYQQMKAEGGQAGSEVSTVRNWTLTMK